MANESNVKTAPETIITGPQPRSARRWSFYQGVMFTGGATAVNIVALFLETIIAVRLLNTQSYGIYVLLVAVVQFLVMFIDFGSKTAMTQMIASSNRLRQAALVNIALIFRLVIVMVISALVWIGQELLILVDSSGALLQYATYLPIMLLVASFDELFAGILQGFQAYHQMAVAQVVRSLLRVGLSFLFLTTLRLGIMALIFSWIISFGATAVYQFLVLPISKRLVFQRQLLGEMLRFGMPLQMSRVMWFVSSQVDVLLLGTLAGPASVAYYAVATRIPRALYRLSESFISVYFPNMTELLAEGQRERARRMLNQSLRLLSFAMAGTALAAVLFSQEIVALLFSDKYAPSSTAFAILMLGLHMGIIVQLMGYTLTSAGHPGRSLCENTMRTALMILGNFVLIPIVGFVGAAFATLAANYASNPLSVWLLRRSDICVRVEPYAKQTATLLLCAMLFWWLQPTEFTSKALIVLLFFVLNLVLSTISCDDLNLALPRTRQTQWTEKGTKQNLEIHRLSS